MKPLELSEDDQRILNTPFKDLSFEERRAAFSISDRIAEWNRSQPYNSIGNVTIVDRDILLRNGVLSPLDQKSHFHNRKDWGEHLKANGCVEVGNDFNSATKKHREIKGDFDCRAELSKVTHQVAEKYGY